MENRSRGLEELLVISTIVLVAAFAPTASGQAGGWEVGHEVQSDLAGKRHKEPLPFDVKFYLYTPPPPGRSAADVKQVWLISGPQASEACRNRTLPEKPSQCPPAPKDMACTLHWVDVKRSMKADSDPIDQIEIEVPRLRVKQDHCFGLEYPLSSDQREALAETIHAALQPWAQKRESLTDVDVRYLCNNLKNALASEARELGLEQRPEAIQCDTAIKAWIAAAGVETAISNAKANIDDAVLKIGEILAEPPPTPPEPDPLAQLRAETDVRSFVLSRGTEASDLPKTAEEAALRRQAVQQKIRALVPSYPDCASGPLPSPKTAPEKIAEHWATVCIELKNLEEALNQNAAAVKIALGDYEPFFDFFGLTATTWAGFEGRFDWYLSLDQGFAYAPDLEESFLHTGMNIYFRPVNKQAPLDQFTFREQLLRRFAVMVGLPTAKLDDDPAWEGLLLDRPLLVGAGVRLSDHIRLTAGALVLNERNPNPLVDDTEGWKLTPFGSLSVDIDLVGRFSGLLGSNQEP